MTPERKLPKTNSPLPSINYKQFISLIILLLVTSPTTQSPSAKYDCPSSCDCDETNLSARCDDLDELIKSYSLKKHKSRRNFMPIESLDLSNNQLTKLTSQLELFENLTELNLSHNELTQVHKLNFKNLKRLDLSYNRITSPKLKKLPKNVVHLNLSHNGITYLPVDFMKLKELRSLELAGNPLHCTCNTLLVRNWLSEKYIWSDKHIICASPSIVKGKPWFQARRADICFDPSSTTTSESSKYNWDDFENDNEIMMGDSQNQPRRVREINDHTDVEYEDDEPADDEVPADEAEDETPTEEKVEEEEEEDKTETKDPFADEVEYDEVKPEEEEEKSAEKVEKSDDDLDEEFIAVSQEPEHNVGSTPEPETVSKVDSEYDEDEEGSGGAIIAPISEAPVIEDDTDESGSGIPLFIPPVHKDDIESSTDFEPIVVTSLGIFEDNTEAPIVAQSDKVSNSEVESVPADKDVAAQSGDLSTASTQDNTGTYVLLGILALCLISLMAFVAMKNRQEKNRNRRYDVERNGATELQDMDKSLLGKPIDRNGNGKAEHAPLINDYPVNKDERPNAYTSFQPPSINVEQPTAAPRDKEKSQQSLYENLPNGNGPVEPVHGSRSPDSDEEVFHPASDSPTGPETLNVSPEPPKRYSPIYSPASPRSERYSPVYSPETGRVKIKLTETPKPKTPVVVTRSKSNAGEYVNTPN